MQDVRFGVEQLVDIAVRALSSNVRDPITALRCIDRLGGAVMRLAGRRAPSPYRFADGRLRVIAPGVSVAEVVAVAVGTIRERGAGSGAVTVRLLETFERVARLRSSRALHEAVLAETVEIERALRSPAEGREPGAMRQHAARVRAVLLADVVSGRPVRAGQPEAWAQR